MSNCTCKKAIPHDNSNCSKCGKQTGNGLLKKEKKMELKNCPFCGGEMPIERSDCYVVGAREIVCRQCGGRMRLQGSIGNITEMWNTRTPSPSADKLIAAAKHIRKVAHTENCCCNLCTALREYQKESE